MSFQPRIFTFYSYKGGVGRSMALLNMAYFLHARGRHVLVVDLDLDAPGASGFLRRTDELLPQTGTGDVVDVLAAAINSARSTRSGQEPTLPSLRLDAFLRVVDPSKYATPVHPKASRARLDVLAADEARDYTARLSALDLPSLSAEQIAQASDLLRGLLVRHRFPRQQPWQEEGAPPEDTAYDYILVDSRTGFSEVGGLCVGPLSDRLIVLCGLNDQNINGTQQFLKLVGLEPKARPANAPAWDDADSPDIPNLRPATLGPKPTLLVASPVPGGEMTYKKERIKVLREAIGLEPLKLSYHPQMALMETIFVRDHPDEYLALEYTAMANRVMGMVGDTIDQLESDVTMLVRRRRREEADEIDASDFPFRLARIALASGQPSFPYSLPLLLNLGLPTQLIESIRRTRINLAPTNDEAAQAWLDWADELDTEDNRKHGEKSVFDSMESKYRRAVQAKEDFHHARDNWAIALIRWATARPGAGAEELFLQAIEKCRQTLEIDQDNHNALNTWGNVLSDWAETRQGIEADELFNSAIEKYRQSVAIKPDKFIAFSNWGIALSQWARKKEGQEAEALFAEAGEKFKLALAIKSDRHQTIFNVACLAGLRGHVTAVVTELEKWRALAPTPQKSKLDNDPDFDRIRDDPQFRAFRESLPD